MHTPTKSGIYGRKGSHTNSAVLRPSSAFNQRSVSDRTPSSSSKPFNTDSDPYSNFASPVGPPISRAGSRTASRATSRGVSKGTQYFQQPPGINAISSSTPQRNAFSRSTSRSSSRLSLSSLGSSSVISSRVPSSTLYVESSLSSTTLGPLAPKGKNAHIQVAVRPKPLNADQSNNENYETSSPWTLDLSKSQIEHSDLGNFLYDHVFSPYDNNENVFDIVALPVINQCLKGYNGTIFAYGMTGSGKTYSMRGVVQHSVSVLFEKIHQRKPDVNGSPGSDRMDQDLISSGDNDWRDQNEFNEDTITVDNENNSFKKIKYMTCSILEIYNEKLNDLLAEHDVDETHYSGTDINRKVRRHNLRIIEDNKFGIKVCDLTEITVNTPEQLLLLVDKGERVRSIDSTDYNYRSSRSHFLIMLKLYMEDELGTEIVSTLNFCDLAGSERATSHSDRRKEGGYINKSLLALGTVITKLSESSNRGTAASHVPYRDSKLTRILQPSLSGGSMVSILCTIQLGSNVVGETTNTLRFGLRAKNVVLNIKRNTADINIDKLIQENESLKLKLSEMESLLSLNQEPDSYGYKGSNNEEISHVVSDLNVSEGNSKDDDILYELIAENNILNEQVEHLKRLQLEDNLLRSQQYSNDLNILSEVLGGLILDNVTRKRTDEVLIRMERGIREYDSRFNEIESYVGHLENRIKVSEIELARYKEQSLAVSNDESEVLNTVSNIKKSVKRGSMGDSEEIVDELREEIEDLKSSMKRKDAMIRALQRAGKIEGV